MFELSFILKHQIGNFGFYQQIALLAFYIFIRIILCWKISGFVPEKWHLRKVLLHYFLSKKVIAWHSCRSLWGLCSSRIKLPWVVLRFQGNRQKKFKDIELETIFSEDSYQAQEEIAEFLGVYRATISRRFKILGFIQKVGKCLKQKDVNRLPSLHVWYTTKRSYISESNWWWKARPLR